MGIEEIRELRCVFESYYKYTFTFYVPKLKKRFGIGGSADDIYRWEVKREMKLGDLLTDEEIKKLVESEEDEVYFDEV